MFLLLAKIAEPFDITEALRIWLKYLFANNCIVFLSISEICLCCLGFIVVVFCVSCVFSIYLFTFSAITLRTPFGID